MCVALRAGERRRRLSPTTKQPIILAAVPICWPVRYGKICILLARSLALSLGQASARSLAESQAERALRSLLASKRRRRLEPLVALTSV